MFVKYSIDIPITMPETTQIRNLNNVPNLPPMSVGLGFFLEFGGWFFCLNHHICRMSCSHLTEHQSLICSMCQDEERSNKR